MTDLTELQEACTEMEFLISCARSEQPSEVTKSIFTMADYSWLNVARLCVKKALAEGSTDLTAQPLYQVRVQDWMHRAIGAGLAFDKTERVHQFLLAAGYLAVAAGCSQDDAKLIMTYCFEEPLKPLASSLGTAAFALTALGCAHGIDMRTVSEEALSEHWETKGWPSYIKSAADGKTKEPPPVEQTVSPKNSHPVTEPKTLAEQVADIAFATIGNPATTMISKDALITIIDSALELARLNASRASSETKGEE